MLKAIAAAIAKLFKTGVGALRWAEDLVFSPFRAIFGGGGAAMPRPEFEPGMTSSELLDEFEAARRQAAVHDLNRDGISTVMRYAKALPDARPTMDLSALNPDVRVTLLSMEDIELGVLGQSGIGAVRKFVAGEEHGVFGVPVVGSVKDTTERHELSAEEKWKIRSIMLKSTGASSEFKLAL
ncbi:hypothetical protein AMC90_CH02878 [Rhizobium phaseoli]|uniref:hypothetical protein n=1 Tax=Rhizobium phaseoli TaxID=396 RepID=UPI0007EA2D38|nr:hypothetical protein [Rhizobium phaseoli]ANL28677.1 hypothetical protein AMC90_CH02878 [Rhizobium phaseoli]ANM05005.1 hypothetical protein AMC78_CH02928 [Rhizobium phaseoli]